MVSRIIIFDMDGVLINSNYAHASAYNMAFAKNNLRKFPDDLIINEFGPPAKTVIRNLFTNLSDRKLAAVVKDKKEFLLNETFSRTLSFDGVAGALAALKKKFKLVLVTNAEHGEIYQLLKAGGVDARLFDALIGSNDIPKPKPAPDVVKKVEGLLNGEVVFVVGDRVEDVKLAKNAEIKSIAVDSGSEELDDLARAGADIIVRSVSLLPEVLL